MTENMQKVLMVLGVVIVAGLLWVGLLGPARDEASAAQDARTQAETAAQSVAGQLATSRLAAERAPANARTLRRLGVAVPEKVEAPALIDQLDRTAKRHDVSFDVLKVSNGAASATPAATAAAGTATPATPAGATADGTPVPGTPATAAAPAGSVPVALDIELAGSYVDVTDFVEDVQSTVRTAGGSKVRADGRLLRIQSVDLSADGEGKGRTLKGTLAVVAYLLPKDTAAASSATTGTAVAPSTATTGTTTTPTTTGSQP